jgi:hypothetical protein
MEALTRLVSESLARHGFDRPLDYRRLHWSRWFRCESHHSLLFVPSKPGVFAVAEEIIGPGTGRTGVASSAPVATGASPVTRSEASGLRRDLPSNQILQTPEAGTRRMLAVTQFFEDDDMAFVLDRMLSHQNPMRSRLTSGRYFIRFVTIEDQFQRRNICAALNQWVTNSAEKISPIGSHFATSLELTPATEYVAQPNDAQPSLFVSATDTPAAADAFVRPASSGAPAATNAHVATGASLVSQSEASGPCAEMGFSAPTFPAAAPHLDSGAAANIHCPSPLPSGF